MIQANFDLMETIKERGKKYHGFIDLCHKVDGSMLRLPYMIVTGEQTGPLFLIDACVHGDEYEGAEAVAEVYQKLDPKDLKGSLVIIPALNPEAFNQGNRVAFMDWSYQDMNRAFPGDPTGMITKRLAHYYFENFVKKADFVLSFHGGGNGLYLEPVATYYNVDSPAGIEVSDITYRMARSFGVQVLWTHDQGATGFTGPLGFEAEKIGKPSIIVELGGQGIRNDHREEMVQLAANGIFNIMKEFSMLEGEVKYRTDHVHVSITYVHTDDGGYHRLRCKPLEFCKKGQVCSEIYNLFGEKINEIKIPFDGYICGYWCYSTIQPGNWAFLFGKPVEPRK